ncbi:hypothetical protein [Photobacterium sp. GB-1]|uniref:hypothetical protein n=1 Tax=Photobacterium sp. GB-1 TaxID=2022111 RepID=UPI000D15C9D9|nr:hypothetical protein [Photobacterium sp. GB-1]PSV52350.1 hypothetical protein C9J45_11885 [Photobacterium sp. GB-1]
MKFVKFLVGMCLCWSVNAQEYVEIIDTGARYSTEYYVKNDGKKYLSSARRDELSDRTNDFYRSHVGHVGKFVYEFYVGDSKRIVLDIDGNYIIVGREAYKPSTESKYLSFQSKIEKRKEFFGLTVGVDKYEDVIKKLDKSDIKYEKRWYAGSAKRPVLYVYGDSNVPVINGVASNEHVLQFINDKLYSIEFWWHPKSNSTLDRKKFKEAKIHEGLIQGLRDKYLIDNSEKNYFAIRNKAISTGKGNWHSIKNLWVSSSQHITVETWTRYPDIKLTYNDTELFEKAVKLDEQLKAEKTKREQEKKAKKNSSSL